MESAVGSNLAMPAHLTAEIALSDREFRVVRGLLYQISGINLTDSKHDLVRVRLGKRLRALGGMSFEDYIEYGQSREGAAELAEMVDSLTTNKTYFFREPAHFDFLRERVLPELIGSREPIRIWSAGCSTGEEPYSLAILMHEEVPRLDGHDIRILGTDISSRVLRVARAGVYEAERVSGLPGEIRDRYFRRRTGSRGEMLWEIRSDVRALVSLAHLNLMDDWPMHRQFDLILCRNVMIYFDNETRQRLVRRFEGQLKDGGYLMVGHSESLTSFRQGLEYIQPAVYRK
jgi:chemotaxis protein methyltransferase CheR